MAGSLGDALRRDHGLSTGVLEPHQGGFASECFVADGEWFVKVWRRDPPANLRLLETLAARGLPVAAPRPTATGELVADVDGRAYAVFPFVRGRTATDDDWSVTAHALREVHRLDDVDLPPATLDEPWIGALRDRLDHEWVRARRHELARHLDRLEAVIAEARTHDVRRVLCHNDFGGFNLLLDEDGGVAAILDWDHALLAPREHDVWIAAEGAHLRPFLEAYGAFDLDLVHLEYALLARALRDLWARVDAEVDRPGIERWGFDRVARLDDDLEAFAAFAA